MYVDPNYSQPPQDLRTLARKYPDPPLVKDTTQQTSNSGGTITADSPIVEKTPTDGAIKKPSVEPSQDTEMEKALIADNMKYLEMATSYINGLSDKEVVENMSDIKVLFEKVKPFLPFLPINVKGMILQMNEDVIKNLFEEKCPAKYKLIVENKKTKKLVELFEMIKKEIA
jgi:hypothetical protein